MKTFLKKYAPSLATIEALADGLTVVVVYSTQVLLLVATMYWTVRAVLFSARPYEEVLYAAASLLTVWLLKRYVNDETGGGVNPSQPKS